MDYSASSRKISVVRVEVFDPGHFPTGSYPGDVPRWSAMVTTKTGLLPEKTTFTFFDSEAEARKFAEIYQPGSQIEEQTPPLDRREAMREYIEEIMDGDRAGDFLNIGGDDGYLGWKITSESGLNDGIRTSQHVLDYLGKGRVGQLKNIHCENWGCAAEFEYCYLNMPHTSPAFIAAAYQFHFFITGNDFSAGYLLRDLEGLVNGVEAEATKSIEMRKNAGAKGRKASENARRKRIISLLEGMEAVAERNPDVASLGPRSLAALGLSEAVKKTPEQWTQGSGQVDEYLGEMRRGEAGDSVKIRYQALFNT